MTSSEVKIRDVILHAPKYFVLNLVIWLIAHNIPLLSIYYTKLYFDQIGKESNINIIIAIMLLLCIRILFIKIGARIDIIAQQKWSEYLYKKAFKSIQERNINENLDSGILLQAINIDVSTIIGTISYSIDTICNIIYGTIAIVILVIIDFKLTLCILILPVLAIVINYVLTAKVVKLSQNVKNDENTFSTKLNGIVNESRNIRVSHREKELKTRFQDILKKQSNNGWRYSTWLGLLNNITNMITELNVFIILIWFVSASSSKRLGVGDIVLFITYSFDIAGMIQYISSLIAGFAQCKVYLQDFNSKFNKLLSIDVEEFPVSIKIKNQIVPQTINVLIGPNGSGKSKLLRQLYLTMERSVLLPDDMNLLNQSIQENIVLGRENSAIISSIECVQLRSEEFFYGFDQIVEIGESNISGGQLFRIALARTIYHSQEILLIDNNFTSVDPIMREKIFENLIKLNKTIVFVDQQQRDYYDNYNCILL